jgi:hypothetical protein
MKVSTAVILFATTTAATITNALIAPSTTGRLSGINKSAPNRRHALTLKMSEVQSEVEKLRAAAAKARAEAVKLARVRLDGNDRTYAPILNSTHTNH